MTFYASGSVFTGSDITVIGDRNIINGSRTTVLGDGNVVTGEECKVFGDGNIVSGSHSTITGDGNTVSGNQSKVTGDGNTVSGNQSKVTGDGNTITGKNSDVRGDGNTRMESEGASNNSGYNFPFANVRNNAQEVFFSAGNITINTNNQSDVWSNHRETNVGAGQVQNNDNARRVLLLGRDITVNQTNTAAVRGPRDFSRPVLDTPAGTIVDGIAELKYTEEQPEGSPCCVICLDREPNVAALPCGHKKFCGICVMEIKEKNTNINQNTKKIQCPVCKSDVDKFAKIY
jgi:hypothetical protein